MKTMRITDIMADFLDSIRAYEHESGKSIHLDERESSEFVDMYFNGGGKINIEESNADEENNLKTAGQVMDEINQMNDGSIMEVYKVKGCFKTKNQSGWTSIPAEKSCPQCWYTMKFTGKALLSNPQQYEYRCVNCGSIRYILDNQNK